jgi:mono/diheme cytochrome c family protein
MFRGFVLGIVLLIVLGIVGGWFVLQHMDISSLNRPGRVENYLAIRAKHILVAHAAQQTLPAETGNSADSIEDGHTTYGSACAGCHGYDGRTPTKLGNSFYPEAPSLAADHVQHYSDAELFVIIRGGIRLSGMPGFGNTQPNDQLWNLVHYVRTLPNAPVHH